jgi:hypothetical protein
LYKFRVKSKNNGEYKCCGFGHNNSASFLTENNNTYTPNTTGYPTGNAWGDAINNGTEFPSGVRCTFITPKSIPGVLNGANDTEEFVYCKWTSNTVIMNIGSMLMCKETLDTLKSSLSSDTDSSLKPFTKGGGSNCIGGYCQNSEKGIRTVNLIPFLATTTYTDLNDLFPYQMAGENGFDGNLYEKWGKALNIFPANSFLNSGYSEKELKAEVGGTILKYYCRIDYDEPDPVDWLPGNIPTYSGGEPLPIGPPEINLNDYGNLNPNALDSELNSYFGCTYNLGKDVYYYAKNDHPYFYFGLTEGSTALDKLKKDFFD